MPGSAETQAPAFWLKPAKAGWIAASRRLEQLSQGIHPPADSARVSRPRRQFALGGGQRRIIPAAADLHAAVGQAGDVEVRVGDA